MIITIILFASIPVFIGAIPEVNHMIQKDHLGRIVAMDVIHDADEKTVMVVIGDVSKYKEGHPTVNFHDYNTGYGVLKNINRQICLLTKTPVPMATAEKYRLGYTTEVHHHLLKNFVVIPTTAKVQDIAGPKIAVFCKDYTTVLADAIPKQIEKRAARQQAREEAANWCVFSSCGTKKADLDKALAKAAISK